MRRYSEANKTDVRKRMGPPHCKSVPAISQELGIHVITLYKLRKGWRVQSDLVPASTKDPGIGAQPKNSRLCWRRPA